MVISENTGYSKPYFKGYKGGEIDKFVGQFTSQPSGAYYTVQYSNDSEIGQQLDNKTVHLPVRAGNTWDSPSTLAIWKIAPENAGETSLHEDGYFNVENVVPQTYLSTMSMPVADWKSVQENKNNSSALSGWMSKTLEEAKTKNVPYVGFFL